MGVAQGADTGDISIHALLAESDLNFTVERAGAQWISIHALLAESDLCRRLLRFCLAYFYPRSPCGERPHQPLVAAFDHLISIHALLAESDQTCL